MTFAEITSFLTHQPLAVLMLCLAAGFFLGRIRIGKLPANTTLSTLLVTVIAGLLFRKFGATLSISGQIGSLAFAFFAFSLGFSAGPGFAETVRRDGARAFLRQGAISVCYAFFASTAAFVAARALQISSPSLMRGLLAGTLTQSTILDPGAANDSVAMVAYGISYIIGLAAAIVFIQTLAPRLLKTSTPNAVKRHMERIGRSGRGNGFVLPTRAIQLRAYRILSGTPLDGGTVGATEAAASGRFEIAAVYRDDVELHGLSQDTRLSAGDVIVVVGDRRILAELPLERVEESVDDRYLSADLEMAEIVIASSGEHFSSQAILDDLTQGGILLRAALRDGRPLSQDGVRQMREGDVLQVAGLAKSIGRFAEKHGYYREDGAPSDLFALSLALCVAAILGTISLWGVSLGTGGCSLLLGLWCGCANRRHPQFAHLPKAAVAFIRSFGLNVFIAVLALGAAADNGGDSADAALSAAQIVRIAVFAVCVAIVPLAGTLAFGRRMLALDEVTLLGGLSGGATCTPALNALEEDTGSSAFAAAYTIPYVVSNVLLTIAGSLVVSLFK